MTAAVLTVIVPGPPQGKGRHRTRVIRKGHKAFAMQYADPKTKSYEGVVKHLAMEAMAKAGIKTLTGPLTLMIVAYMPVPASWPGWKRDAALDGRIQPSTKPDADNLVKVADALNGVAWVDDVQVVRISVVKLYAEVPSLMFTIETMPGKVGAQVASKMALQNAAGAE